jgi:hypothetical protein
MEDKLGKKMLTGLALAWLQDTSIIPARRERNLGRFFKGLKNCVLLYLQEVSMHLIWQMMLMMMMMMMMMVKF